MGEGIKHDLCETCDERITDDRKLIRFRGFGLCVSFDSIECLREFLDEIEADDDTSDGIEPDYDSEEEDEDSE